MISATAFSAFSQSHVFPRLSSLGSSERSESSESVSISLSKLIFAPYTKKSRLDAISLSNEKFVQFIIGRNEYEKKSNFMNTENCSLGVAKQSNVFVERLMIKHV